MFIVLPISHNMRLERNKASSGARLRAEDVNECGGGLRFEKKSKAG